MTEVMNAGGAAPEGVIPLWPEIVTIDMAVQPGADQAAPAIYNNMAYAWSHDTNKRHMANLIRSSLVNVGLVNLQPGGTMQLRNPNIFPPAARQELTRDDFQGVVTKNLELVAHGAVERAIMAGDLPEDSYALPVHLTRSILRTMRLNSTGVLQMPRLELFPIDDVMISRIYATSTELVPEQSRAFILSVDKKLSGKKPETVAVRGLIAAVDSGAGNPNREMRTWTGPFVAEKSVAAWREAGMKLAREQYAAKGH
ncbi:MAG TPA: hypothetical protein VLG11_03240 [Candidatus Saccharimonadales bacterium]|nr:hypothetical protein [Candidatus Saccharimonadales bacterium]